MKQIVSDTRERVIQTLLLAVISEAQGDGLREGGREMGQWMEVEER